jgi:hypothetical protein
VLDERTTITPDEAQPGTLGANELPVGDSRLFQHGEYA